MFTGRMVIIDAKQRSELVFIDQALKPGCRTARWRGAEAQSGVVKQIEI